MGNEIELNVRQKNAVKADEPKILCLASAASGKTRTLTERIKFLILRRKVKQEDIVAITFTNAAAQEMHARLGTLGDKVFIGTIHSYANRLCVNAGIDTTRIIAEEKYDDLLRKAMLIPRSNLKTIQHLLIDECQDIGKLEFRFLTYLKKHNEYWTGDEKQMIYAFKGASDEYLRDMYEDEEYKKYYLVENYRNTPEIITFAETFIRQKESLSPSSIPVKTQNGFIEHCRIDEALDELEASGNWGAWFVIARSNRDVDLIMEKLRIKGIPCITFKRAELDLNQMESLMTSNTVKVMTIHTAKGLESPNVIAVGAKTYNSEERRIAYVAATRAETNLYWCPTITKAEGRKPEGDIEGSYKTKRTGQSAFGEVITF